jgi:transcriptional regulator with XRE-family HTH domain
MKGSELVEWRQRNGYSQVDLMKELAKSRQTVSTWERPDAEVPRLVELALIALERHPDCRITAGQKATRQQAKEFGRKWAGVS